MMDLKEWIWDESVWKTSLFGLREKWWDLKEKFVSVVICMIDIFIFLIDKIVNIENLPMWLKIIEGNIINLIGVIDELLSSS